MTSASNHGGQLSKIPAISPSNHASRFTSEFFLISQVLPTHRLAHSPYGGPFQPTMTQAIRLLSRGPFTSPTGPHPAFPPESLGETPSPSTIADPFSSALDTVSYTYTTTSTDVVPAPASHPNHRHAWLHVFPEGRIHQHPERAMRYFKWGVARLILEAEPCPEVVPIFVDGFDQVMPEDRGAPRWMPRPGKAVRVVFGERVPVGKWDGVRARWRELLAREGASVGTGEGGVLTESLREGEEAKRLRSETASLIRDEVMRLRQRLGYPDDDPKPSVEKTKQVEGGKREGLMEDDSWVGRT